MQNPDLFVSGDFKLELDDFPHRFHKIVFSAIHHLYNTEHNSIGVPVSCAFIKQ
jgi:replicative DNA helicase